MVLTCSADGTCVSWDLNTFSYIRTVARHEEPIDVACISPTLGDVATSSKNAEQESCLMVHTINGASVSQFKTEVQITALCYSAAPEGTSVNVLLTAFADGSIRLWSSWDLAPVHTLRADNYSKPIKW